MHNPNIMALNSLLIRKNINFKVQTAIILFTEHILCVMYCGKYFCILSLYLSLANWPKG